MYLNAYSCQLSLQQFIHLFCASTFFFFYAQQSVLKKKALFNLFPTSGYKIYPHENQTVQLIFDNEIYSLLTCCYIIPYVWVRGNRLRIRRRPINIATVYRRGVRMKGHTHTHTQMHLHNILRTLGEIELQLLLLRRWIQRISSGCTLETAGWSFASASSGCEVACWCGLLGRNNIQFASGIN